MLNSRAMMVAVAVKTEAELRTRCPVYDQQKAISGKLTVLNPTFATSLCISILLVATEISRVSSQSGALDALQISFVTKW